MIDNCSAISMCIRKCQETVSLILAFFQEFYSGSTIVMLIFLLFSDQILEEEGGGGGTGLLQS